MLEGEEQDGSGLSRVSLSRHLLCPRVRVCTRVCGVSVHACTSSRDTEPATMHCLFSGSCCPHLQSGRLHLFKKKPDTVVVEPERKVAVRWGRETPAPSALPIPRSFTASSVGAPLHSHRIPFPGGGGGWVVAPAEQGGEASRAGGAKAECWPCYGAGLPGPTQTMVLWAVAWPGVG